jgi:alanyl-tRNA synthetase
VTNKRYFDKPLIYEFTAQVLEAQYQDDGTSNIILDQTYFYPSGGGQSHDRGLLGELRILDVRKENGTVIHVVEGEITLGQVDCQIDANYRLGNMQAHTGQHILSAAFLRVLQADTLAVKMNADMPSTVDFNRGELSLEQIQAVETLANQVIMENRPIKSYFVAPDSAKLEELRRAVKFEKVTGDVRLVEIEDFDLSACAGTHFPNTGMLGLLKILKAENYKGGARIHFAAGYQALEQFRRYHQGLEAVSNFLSASIDDVYSLVQKIQSERQDLDKQVKSLREQILSYESVDLLAKVEHIDELKLVKMNYEDRTSDELRVLANLLSAQSQTAAVLVNRIGENITVIVCAADDSNIHAGNTLKAILTQFDGRGGGRENYAQGVLKGFKDIEALMQTINSNLISC